MQQQYERQEPLLQVKDLQKHFRITNPLGKVTGHVKAVNHVTFDLFEKETLGLVGESGCGKSTTGRTILRLTEPTSGAALYQGQDIFSLKEKEFMPIRKEMQMVFQDPHSSLNPKKESAIALKSQ